MKCDNEFRNNNYDNLKLFIYQQMHRVIYNLKTLNINAFGEFICRKIRFMLIKYINI